MRKGVQTILAITSVVCGLWAASLSMAAESPEPEEPAILVGGELNYSVDLGKAAEPTGYAVELTRAIAREMGLNIKIILMPHEMLLEALQNGKVHILMSVIYTKSGTETLDFSPPHDIETPSLFGRKNSPPINSMYDWQNKDVMVQDGSAICEMTIERGCKSVIRVESIEEMFRLLASGKRDYALASTRIGVDLIRELGLNNLEPMVRLPITLLYCFAVKKGNDKMLDQFNKGLAILYRTGEYKRIHDKWLGSDLEPHGIPWPQVIKYGGIIVALFLAAVGIIFFWSIMLKKQVVQRTAALSLEIKQRQRVEDELRRNQEQLIQSSKLAAIGTLVSGVAHEINNPNGLILLNLAMLKEIYEDISYDAEDWYHAKGDFDVGKWRYSELREKLGAMLSGSIGASEQISRIVEDLKDFSRQGNAELNEDVNLNLVARDAVRLVENAIKKSTDAFIVQYENKLPKIRGNVQRLKQVIVNIVLNACQALTDRNRKVMLKTRWNADRQMVELEVTDEGIGIAQEQLRHITDPFYTTKREQGGTGLGLSISSAIVKEHEGFLTFKSVQGKGTTVILSLPALENKGL